MSRVGVFHVFLETQSTKNTPLKNRPIVGKLPLIFIILGLALSLIGVALIPEFSPIASPSSTSIPICGSGLFLVLIGLILIFLFYFRRQKNR